MRFRERIYRFLYGRYGVDDLFFVFVGVAAVVAFVNCFLRIFWLQLPVYLLIFGAVFRLFSRNIAARQRENEFCRGWIARLRKNRQTRQTRKADRCHVYRKCPSCGVTLRLPRKKGKHRTVCPHCDHPFAVFVFKE